MTMFWTDVVNFWLLEALLFVCVAPLIVVVAAAALVSEWFDDRNRKAGS